MIRQCVFQCDVQVRVRAQAVRAGDRHFPDDPVEDRGHVRAVDRVPLATLQRGARLRSGQTTRRGAAPLSHTSIYILRVLLSPPPTPAGFASCNADECA